MSDQANEDDFIHYFNATARLSKENERLRKGLERIIKYAENTDRVAPELRFARFGMIRAEAMRSLMGEP